MIIAILAVYGAILALLDKIGIISWNRYWAATFPALWALLQLVILIPMGWGSPQGPALMVRSSVQIVPSVAGEVIDVPVEGSKILKPGDELFRIDPRPYQAAVDSIQAQLTFQEERLAQAMELQRKNVGPVVDVLERQAAVDNLRGQLETAKWNLEKTVVRAPSEGFVTAVALRKGARVGGAPVMAFIETKDDTVAVEIAQNNARYIEAGQPVELAFKSAPGAIYTGKVDIVFPGISTGQEPASGMAATPRQFKPAPFVILVDLDDREAAKNLPMGSVGQAAIYTGHYKASEFIRRVLLRQISIINYVNPF